MTPPATSSRPTAGALHTIWLLGPFLPAPVLVIAVLAFNREPPPVLPAGPPGELGPGELAMGERAHALAREITACGPHPPGTPCHETARRAVHAALSGLGVPVRLELFDDERDHLVNLHVRLPPRTPAAAGRIVIGAHYDSVSSGPGAVDDAGGVAVLVETARLLLTVPAAHEVHLIAFDGEETGLRGSHRHVTSSSAADRDAIVAAVVLEMVGWPGESLVTHTFRNLGGGGTARAAAPGWLLSAVARGGRSASAAVPVGDPLASLPYQVLVRNLRVPFASDDFPFLAAGVPALFISGSSFSNFYPEYHQPGDTADRLAPGPLARAVRLVEGTIRSLDGRVPAPRTWGDDQALLLSGSLLPRWALLLALALAALPALVHARRSRGQLLAALAAAGLALGGAALDALTVAPLCAPALWVAALWNASTRAPRLLATGIAAAAPLATIGLFAAAVASYPDAIGLSPYAPAALLSAGGSLVAMISYAALSPRRRQ